MLSSTKTMASAGEGFLTSANFLYCGYFAPKSQRDRLPQRCVKRRRASVSRFERRNGSRSVGRRGRGNAVDPPATFSEVALVIFLTQRRFDGCLSFVADLLESSLPLFLS